MRSMHTSTGQQRFPGKGPTGTGTGIGPRAQPKLLAFLLPGTLYRARLAIEYTSRSLPCRVPLRETVRRELRVGDRVADADATQPVAEERDCGQARRCGGLNARGARGMTRMIRNAVARHPSKRHAGLARDAEVARHTRGLLDELALLHAGHIAGPAARRPP